MLIVIADLFQKGVEQLFFNIIHSSAQYKKSAATKYFRTRKEETDDRHLEEIRAIFGAHPFDITSEGKGRGCCHWLGDSPTWHGKTEATISLPEGKIKFFSLDLGELWKFIEHRYGLLAHITEKIKSDRMAFIKKMKKTPILLTENMSPIEQLDILYKEAGKSNRGKIGDGYQDEVRELRDIFSCTITSPDNVAMVETYKKALVPLIEKQREILQNMAFTESWEDEPLLDAFALGLSEQYSKDVQDLRVISEKSFLAEATFRSMFQGKFCLEYNTYSEFFLLIRAYLFSHPNIDGDND